ncbi:hypothetical protein LIER_32606 [Lithospermum erythrorhizon]|uniref:Myb/SANT-like domain-containing protein n=1 Tax=Lithospermum erythrorhizon TaxID=34254 RepID=A0AAV3RW37_LITER
MDAISQEERGPGKNKRKWTNIKDEKLVAALVDMVNIGAYKTENGFKAGFLTYLKETLKVTLPNSGLKGKPHIDSRIKTLKGQFNIVYDMLNSPNVSGFGWDPTTNCLVTEKPVWDAYLQNRPRHATWKNKSFPFYDDFLVIFGKDRSTRLHVETPTDVVSEINQDQTNVDGEDGE